VVIVQDIAFIVPVKPFKRAKSRLVEVFPAGSRLAMQERVGVALFDDTMDVLGSFMSRHGQGRVCTIACSSDPAVEARVAKLGHGFIFIDETEAETGSKAPIALDQVIEHANQYAMRELGVKGTILLVSDVPLLTVHALVGLFKRIEVRAGFMKVILSPSMGNGCNMIARFPPDIIPTRYSSKHGPSFIEHLAMAKERAAILGIPSEQFVEIYNNLDLYLDLDTPDDLLNLYPLLKELRPGSRLSRVLDGMDVRIEKRDCDDTRHVSIRVDINGHGGT
jgi:2-phospho-L-lactate guanylyltransferase (CobY/MobA/RfbA family)